MKDEHKRALVSGLRGATRGAAVAGAGSILSGVAMVSVPIKIFFGLIVVGTSTVIAAPVVAAVAAGGAVVGGATAAFIKYRQDAKTKKMFDDLMNSKSNSNDPGSA